LCNYGGLKSQDVEVLLEIFVFFLVKTTPYGKIFKILFRKYSLPHQSTQFCRRKIGVIVRYLPVKKFACLLNCRYCTDRAQSQNLPGAAPNNVLKSAPDFIQIVSLSAESLS